MSRLDAIRKMIVDKETGRSFRGKSYINDELLAEWPEGPIKKFRSQAGQNFIKILPPRRVDAYYGVALFVHRELGCNSDSFICPNMTRGTACPVCEFIKKIKPTLDLTQEAAREFIRKLSCLPPRWGFFVVNMASDDTMVEGPQWYDAPQTINDQFLTLSKHPRTGEVVDLSDPREGWEFSFVRTGEGMKTRYSGYRLGKNEAWDDRWLSIPDFDEVVVMSSYEEIDAAFDAGVLDIPGADPEEVTSMPSRLSRDDKDSRVGNDDPPAGRPQTYRQTSGVDEVPDNRTFRDQRPAGDTATRAPREDVGRLLEEERATTGDDEGDGADSRLKRIRERVSRRLEQ